MTQTAFGFVAFLKRSFASTYPKDVAIIKIIVKFETEHRLRVKVFFF